MQSLVRNQACARGSPSSASLRPTTPSARSGINRLIQAAIPKSRGDRNAQNLITSAYPIAGELDFFQVLALSPSPT